MAGNPFQRSPEQLAFSQERKLERQQKKRLKTAEDKGQILARQWIQLESVNDVHDYQHLKILSWNLLAQCLVRRELFPTSNCLKASQREPMIHREILSQRAQVICLQEVDRLDSLLPVLDEAGLSHVYTAGPRKKHGCLIAFDKNIYIKFAEKVIRYDEQEVEKHRRGGCIRTSNIASLIALKPQSGQRGLIVASTHLFWHPKYTYERARQAGILVREVAQFRRDIGRLTWPCIICGDFNFAPDDAAYSLLIGDPLLPAQEESLSQSRVVHVSIDPGVPLSTVTGEGDDSTTDPDKVITDARPALPEDGLLSNSELAALFLCQSPLRSAYDEGQYKHRTFSTDLPTFGDRVMLQPQRHGAYEPAWTSFTHYWQTVLDYIFVLDPVDSGRVTVAGFLKPHGIDDLRPGLPQMGVCGSDHVSLCTELLLPR